MFDLSLKIYDTKHRTVLQQDETGRATYIEVPYTEYREDGSIKCTGSEDFTAERYKTLVTRSIYVPTGKLNKGGHRTWEQSKRFTTASTKSFRRLATFFVEGEFVVREY